MNVGAAALVEKDECANLHRTTDGTARQVSRASKLGETQRVVPTPGEGGHGGGLMSHVAPRGDAMIRTGLSSPAPCGRLTSSSIHSPQQRSRACCSHADTKFNTGWWRKCEIRKRKLAGPSLF